MLFLSADDCRELLDTAAILRAVEDALRMDARGEVRWSTPPDLRVGRGAGAVRVRVKAGALDGVAGVRVLVFPEGRPDIRWIVVLDDATGEPMAIVDETWTYPRRSIAAVTLVAHTVRPPEVRRVGLIGAGRIAGSALPFIGHLFPGAALAVSSRREETRRDLAQLAATQHGMEASPVVVEQAVRGSQVVLACTSATSAVLDDAWVEPGTVVGSLETVECGPGFFARADLRIVDSREQLEGELVEAYGPGAPGRIDASMDEVIIGAHPGRGGDHDRILVLGQGLMSQDLLLAVRAYREASARGIGTPLPIAGV